MIITFLHDWNHFDSGDIAEVDEAQARELLKSGTAKEYEAPLKPVKPAEKPKAETKPKAAPKSKK